MPKLSLLKNRNVIIQPIAGDNGVINFTKGDNPKIKWLRKWSMKLAYIEATVQHVRHYTKELLLKEIQPVYCKSHRRHQI